MIRRAIIIRVMGYAGAMVAEARNAMWRDTCETPLRVSRQNLATWIRKCMKMYALWPINMEPHATNETKVQIWGATRAA